MAPVLGWPATDAELALVQEKLARERPAPWFPPRGALAVAGVALVSSRGASGRGAAGDPSFAAAALLEVGEGRPPREIAASRVRGAAGAPFETGLLALREGPLLEAAVRALPGRPDVLLVHAAGRDHPRRAGLALMLGAALDLPSVGVTARPLLARGDEPAEGAGASSALVLEGEEVGAWVRTRAGVRPVAVHCGWRTSPDVAVRVALLAAAGVRMPEPLRRALEVARAERAAAVRRT